MIPLIYKFDNSILIFIKNNMHGFIMDKLMIAATTLGNSGTVWIAIVIFLLISKKYRKVGIMVLCSLLLGTVLGEGIIKHLVQRARPFQHIPSMKLLVAKPSSYSFPSGHTTASFASVVVLAKYFKKYAVGFFTLAFLIAFSRLYLYVHYPTDVLVGMILGLTSGKVTIYLFGKYKWLCPSWAKLRKL